MAWTIVVGVYLAWTLWNWVIARMDATQATIFLYLVPVVSGGVSWLFLDEQFGYLKMAGALVALSGLALAPHAATPKRPFAPEKGPQHNAPPHTVRSTCEGSQESLVTTR